MAERAVATSRDTLDAAVVAWIARDCEGSIVGYLIDSGAVRVVDPADPALVERVAKALAPATYGQGPELEVLDRFQLTDEGWRTKASAAIGAVFGDQ